MKASLSAAGRPHVRQEYVNKAFPDGHASRTVACFAEMLQAGASSAERQETANNIFHVVSPFSAVNYMYILFQDF